MFPWGFFIAMTKSKPNPSTVPQRLQAGTLDVLIVGGGIVGAGIARDAAMRGFKTGLIEQHDFASGTSSRSSRLLHGGIRYLAQARVGLVREASHEKTIIHRIAPHLSDPLAFIFPTRKNSDWSKWKLAIGVKLYDLLCGRRNLGKSRVLSKDATLGLLPGLETKGLTGSVRYYDGLTNDSRLVIDTLRSAEEQGATVGNYLRFLNADFQDGAWLCEIENAASGELFRVNAKCLINAAGPWSHVIPNSRTTLRLTKGVHLVLDRSRLPVPDAVVVTEGDRILFVIPWGQRVIIGTTDTDYGGPIGSPTCDPEDISYVLDAANEAFPAAGLVEQDVISTWAGLRPLVADSRGNPSDISRRHVVTMSHPGWWDVTGGKLTTYRLMAEETVDCIARYLKTAARPCRTAHEPLLPEPSGECVSGVLPPEVTRTVVEQCCGNEWARHLDDVMIRRTSWAHYHPDHIVIAEQVAEWMADCLGWSPEKLREEIEGYRQLTHQQTAGQRVTEASPSANGAANSPHYQHQASQASRLT